MEAHAGHDLATYMQWLQIDSVGGVGGSCCENKTLTKRGGVGGLNLGLKGFKPVVTPRDQGSELSSATMIPQMTVLADLTRSEDWSLKPGYAVGDCHARWLPSVHEAQ